MDSEHFENVDNNQQETATTHSETSEQTEQPARKQSRFGIGGRLYAAFGFTAAATVIATAVAWVSFSLVGGTLTDITEKHIPAISGSLKLAKESANLAAAAPTLAAAEDQDRRTQVMEGLVARWTRIEGLIGDIGATGQKEAVAEIETISRQFNSAINDLNARVEERLKLQNRRSEMIATVTATHARLLKTLTPLVDDANFNLVLAGEDTSSGTKDALQTLNSETVRTLMSAVGVKTTVDRLWREISQSASAVDEDALGAIEGRFELQLPELEKKLADLPDTPETEDLKAVIATLLRLATGDDTVFDLRRQELKAGGLTEAQRKALAERRANVEDDLAFFEADFLSTIMPLINEQSVKLTGGTHTIAQEMETAVTQLLEGGVGELRSILELEASANLVAGLLTAAANEPTVAGIQPLRERFVAAASHMQNALTAIGDSGDTGTLRADAEALIGFGAGDNSLFDLRTHELEIAAVVRETLSQNRTYSDTLSARVAELVDDVEWTVAVASEETSSMIEFDKLLLIGIAAASVALSILIAWLYVGRRVVRRLTGLAWTMDAITGGDLETEIAESGNDEITAMAHSVRVFRDNTVEMQRLEEEQKAAEARAEIEKREAMEALADDFERQVKGVVEAVSASATQMQSTAQSMTTSAEQSSQQASTVASASEEASTNVQTVASAAEQLSASISEISQQVVDSARIANEATAEAERTNASVEGLNTAAQKIGDVVELINDIASQTNLLALNATIEAARAGEAGKGFAVVASEVKNLATQTAKATEEIAMQISSMQEETTQAVGAIKGITETIGKVNEIATSISSAVEQQGAATNEISRNVQEAARGTQEVSTNITGVTQASQETGSAASQVLSAAGDLTRQSGDLRTQVETFVQQIRAA